VRAICIWWRVEGGEGLGEEVRTGVARVLKASEDGAIACVGSVGTSPAWITLWRLDL